MILSQYKSFIDIIGLKVVQFFHFKNQVLSESELTKAREALKYFAARFGEIYGEHHLVYNVHSLIHLADDRAIHGPLDSFSCFPFETFLGKLKKLPKSPAKPLAQLVRRISEIQNVETFKRTIAPSIFNRRGPHALMENLKTGTRSDSFYLTRQGTVLKVIFFLTYLS